ncbi:Mitochondrial delta(3,5)-delta(2,4)-dienoyl-CoA isomerase [Lachnellula suecica]|uniref:Mitochondrial delta(3,5)-delta(2,4)-dienoyl-CoA isomerase n=1 Tax=Lachnellula suecica TaxID=602035 RepID=A0A8T9CHE1_9HELO|nr:Mitochondrial delta(3,5)-delta(2,4)-dienoyl-CoA isomerase [Lachnellula suecica]
MAPYRYNFFLVTFPKPFIAVVEINRPARLNAFLRAMWLELKEVFESLSYDPDVRVVILIAAGERAFSVGLDVQAAESEGGILHKEVDGDVARKAVGIRKTVREIQGCLNAIENCQKPVICVLHGISYGFAVDIAVCCDIRLCSADVKFSVKEVDIGLAADLGSLNRLPKIVGDFGWVKDVCMTARTFGAEEALQVGFARSVKETKSEAISESYRMARYISCKSPVAVQGTKALLNYSRDHHLADSLEYTGVWNSAAVQTSDVSKALLSGIQKRTPTFEKL